MSPDEVQDFCKTILPYKLRVRVKLKNEPEIQTGRIKDVQKDRFEFVGDDNVLQILRYNFVARITNA